MFPHAEGDAMDAKRFEDWFIIIGTLALIAVLGNA